MKDLARQRGVSYEAVRSQVKRYAAELEGHTYQQGRVKYLDEWAVDYLDAKRSANPVVVYHADQQDELQDLREQNRQLLLQLADAQAMVIELQGKLLEISGTKDAPGELQQHTDAAASGEEEPAAAPEPRKKTLVDRWRAFWRG